MPKPLCMRLARSWATLVLAITMAFALSCDQTTAQQETKPQTLDDLFADVARRVPEFGGMFLSKNEQKLHVFLTSVAAK